MTAAKATGNENAFEDLAHKIRENGVGYLAGVKKVHSLLAPHASLVKSYQNLDSEQTETIDKQGSAQHKEEASKANEIVKKAASSMYSARVEQRLALERSAVLKEMIRLEEMESATNDVDGHSEGESAAAGSKRKAESIR
jgi:hypothetical protein